MKYSIIKEKNIIRAYCEGRLNFEPKDWRKDFKKDLSYEIRKLIPDGEFLKARLITAEEDFFDVENVLFYNLGTANFKDLDNKGVWFSLEKGEELSEKRYVHEYGFVNSLSGINGDIIADWSNIIIEKPTTSKKPLDYWISFKQSNNVKVNCTNYHGHFGLDIEIKRPRNDVINIISIQKPLLDGIISVFHESANVDLAAIEYIASKVNLSFADIHSLISNNKLSILPKRNIVQKYRYGIKWNPQDENCTEVRIVVRETDDKFYKISGRMFKKQ